MTTTTEKSARQQVLAQFKTVFNGTVSPAMNDASKAINALKAPELNPVVDHGIQPVIDALNSVIPVMRQAIGDTDAIVVSDPPPPAQPPAIPPVVVTPPSPPPVAAGESPNDTLALSIKDYLGNVFSIDGNKALLNGVHSATGWATGDHWLYLNRTPYLVIGGAFVPWDYGKPGLVWSAAGLYPDPHATVSEAQNDRTKQSSITLQMAINSAAPNDLILLADVVQKNTTVIRKSISLASANRTDKRLPLHKYGYQPIYWDLTAFTTILPDAIGIPTDGLTEAILEATLYNPHIKGWNTGDGLNSAISPVAYNPILLKVLDGFFEGYNCGIAGGPVISAPAGTGIILDGTRGNGGGNGNGLAHGCYIPPYRFLQLIDVFFYGVRFGHTFKSRTWRHDLIRGIFRGDIGDYDTASQQYEACQGGGVTIRGTHFIKGPNSDSLYAFLSHGREWCGRTGGHKIYHDGYVDKWDQRGDDAGNPSIMVNKGRDVTPRCVFVDFAMGFRAWDWVQKEKNDLVTDRGPTTAEERAANVEEIRTQLGVWGNIDNQFGGNDPSKWPVYFENTILSGSGADEHLARIIRNNWGGDKVRVVPLSKMVETTNEYGRPTMMEEGSIISLPPVPPAVIVQPPAIVPPAVFVPPTVVITPPGPTFDANAREEWAKPLRTKYRMVELLGTAPGAFNLGDGWVPEAINEFSSLLADLVQGKWYSHRQGGHSAPRQNNGTGCARFNQAKIDWIAVRPSDPNPGQQYGVSTPAPYTPEGNPVSAHTYNDGACGQDGGPLVSTKACGANYGSQNYKNCDLYDLATGTFRRLGDYPGTASPDCGGAFDYENQIKYSTDIGGGLHALDIRRETWSTLVERAFGGNYQTYVTGAKDPKRSRLMFSSTQTNWVWDNQAAEQGHFERKAFAVCGLDGKGFFNLPATGPGAQYIGESIARQQPDGFDYDPDNELFLALIGWAGVVVSVHPETGFCDVVASGLPGAAGGCRGRWKYWPRQKVFAYAPSFTSNLFAMSTVNA